MYRQLESDFRGPGGHGESETKLNQKIRIERISNKRAV